MPSRADVRPRRGQEQQHGQGASRRGGRPNFSGGRGGATRTCFGSVPAELASEEHELSEPTPEPVLEPELPEDPLWLEPLLPLLPLFPDRFEPPASHACRGGELSATRWASKGVHAPCCDELSEKRGSEGRADGGGGGGGEGAGAGAGVVVGALLSELPELEPASSSFPCSGDSSPWFTPPPSLESRPSSLPPLPFEQSAASPPSLPPLPLPPLPLPLPLPLPPLPLPLPLPLPPPLLPLPLPPAYPLDEPLLPALPVLPALVADAHAAHALASPPGTSPPRTAAALATATSADAPATVVAPAGSADEPDAPPVGREPLDEAPPDALAPPPPPPEPPPAVAAAAAAAAAWFCCAWASCACCCACCCCSCCAVAEAEPLRTIVGSTVWLPRSNLACSWYHSLATARTESPMRCLKPYAFSCLVKKDIRLCLKNCGSTHASSASGTCDGRGEGRRRRGRVRWAAPRGGRADMGAEVGGVRGGRRGRLWRFGVCVVAAAAVAGGDAP